MLKVNNLRAGYGAINVLWDVSLECRDGELTTLIGPNGAGKTTLLRAVMGLIPHAAGTVELNGRMLGGKNTWEMAASGLVLIPEGRALFRDMTVEENLVMGAYPANKRANMKPNMERVFDLFPRLKERRRQASGSLSGGEAQMLAIGRGIMSEPSLLLIDEPSLGLAPLLVREIFNILSELKSQGVTILLIEQNTHQALNVADRVYLMRSGKMLMEGEASKVDLSALHDLYFGSAQTDGAGG